MAIKGGTNQMMLYFVVGLLLLGLSLLIAGSFSMNNTSGGDKMGGAWVSMIGVAILSIDMMLVLIAGIIALFGR